MYIFVAIKSVSVRSQPKGDVHVRKAPCPQAMQCNLKYLDTGPAVSWPLRCHESYAALQCCCAS